VVRWRCRATGFLARGAAGEEKLDRYVERARNMIEPAGRDAAEPALVFVSLLKGDADLARQSLERDALFDASRPNPGRNLLVDQLGRLLFH
jgi:hypothetical protein